MNEDLSASIFAFIVDLGERGLIKINDYDDLDNEVINFTKTLEV